MISAWHFVYAGYSRTTRRYFGFLQLKTGPQSIDSPNFNHYLSERFYFVQRDARYNNYNGQVSVLNVNYGPGAFKAATDSYATDNDVFGYTAGVAKLQPVVQPVSTSSGANVVPAATDQASPLT
jgi:hypothetical protein